MTTTSRCETNVVVAVFVGDLLEIIHPSMGVVLVKYTET